jgi:hypothetical protein
MGGLGSTRWGGHTKKRMVEECQRVEAPLCRRCGRSVRYLYLPPCDSTSDSLNAPNTSGLACRICHRLTYASVQLRRTPAMELARDSCRLADARRAALKIFGETSLLSEPPPDEVVRQGRRAVGRWFRERDTAHSHALRQLHFVNRVPVALQSCPLQERKKKRRRKQ